MRCEGVDGMQKGVDERCRVQGAGYRGASVRNGVRWKGVDARCRV